MGGFKCETLVSLLILTELLKLYVSILKKSGGWGELREEKEKTSNFISTEARRDEFLLIYFLIKKTFI